MPRWLLAALIILGAITSSGVIPAAAAALGCGDECERQGAGADCPDDDGVPGCPPLCSSCVCASYMAPILGTAEDPVVIAVRTVAPAIVDEPTPPSAPGPRVFHPPRSAR